MKEIRGFCILHKDTGERWGGLFESEKGAITSFNKTRGPFVMHESGRRTYWHEQDILYIAPLFTETS